MKGLGPPMIGIVTAQELRANLGDVTVAGRTCTEWIDRSIAEIERDFMKPEHRGRAGDGRARTARSSTISTAAR